MPCCGLGSDLIKLERLKAPQGVEPPTGLEDYGLQVSCPECGWEITSDFTWCPQCGLRTKPYQCAYCRGWIPVGLTACPRCGAP